jgi:hypothetical protein
MTRTSRDRSFDPLAVTEAPPPVVTPEETTTRGLPEVKVDEQPKALRFLLPEGRELTTARGKLGAGDEVFALDLANGEEQLAALVAAGFLTKV